MSCNIEELRKSVYPKFFENNLIFDPEQNKSIQHKKGEYVTLYCAYIFYDDYFEITTFIDLESCHRSEFSCLYIFRVKCPFEDYNEYKILSEGYFKPMMHIGSNHLLDLFSEDSICEELPLYHKINKSDITNKSPNMYLNLTSKEFYSPNANYLCYDYPFTFIRIIVYKDNDETKFRIIVYKEINEEFEEYSYDDYDLYQYAIPPNKLNNDLISQILFERFKKTYLK